jgi:hypothetical protein
LERHGAAGGQRRVAAGPAESVRRFALDRAPSLERIECVEADFAAVDFQPRNNNAMPPSRS